MLTTSKVMILLRWLSCAVFLGRAWQHLFFDIPIRSVLWDERLMSRFVEQVLKLDWETYISSAAIDSRIQALVVGVGIFYIICAVLSLILKNHQQKLGILLLVGSSFLIVLALLYWKEKFQSFGQFIEYSLQFSTPIFLYLALFKIKIDQHFQRLVLFMKIAVALTFIGHGLYALGVYPVPSTYVEMMINVFYFSDTNAILFLKIAGMLDLIAAVAIFIPSIQKPFLWYCVIWGTLTALARLVANFYWQIPLDSLHQWAYASVYRMPHGGIPLAILWLIKKR